MPGTVEYRLIELQDERLMNDHGMENRESECVHSTGDDMVRVVC